MATTKKATSLGIDTTLPRNPHKPTWYQFEFGRKPTHRPATLRNPRIEGWDSETIQHEQWGNSRGKAFLINNSRHHLIVPHDNPITSILKFFTDNAHNGNIHVWWNIDYDIRTIFKWDMSLLQSLYPENGGIATSTYGPWEIVYLKKKMLIVRHTIQRHTVRMYDAALFYRQPLAQAALRYLKRQAPEMKMHRSEDLYSRFLETPDPVIKYCQWDATATRDLMALFYSRLARLNFYPRKPISSGYLAQDYIRTFTDFPFVFDVPSYVNRAAWESFRGGWIDIWKRGTLNVWKYDINSAYPYAMQNLPDIRDGSWTHEYVRESEIGFVLVDMRQSMNTVPCIATWMKAVHGYPWMDETTRLWLTKCEYETLSAVDGVHFQPVLWYCFVPKANAKRPFANFVTTLVTFKNESHPKHGKYPDDAAYLAAKELVNSGYGKTCERTPLGDGKFRPGKLFMPPYAATITAKTRCLIIPHIKHDPGMVVSIATDCLTTTKPLRLPLDDWELGKWKIEAEDETGIFVSPGIYEIGNHTTHNRGFRIATCLCGHLNHEHAGSCKRCQCTKFHGSLKELLKNAGETLDIAYDRPWGVREAIRQSDLDMVGVFERKSYDKSLDSTRRLWIREPPTFSDLLTNAYDSMPVPVSLIK